MEDTVTLGYKGQMVFESHHQDGKPRVFDPCSHKYLWIIMSNDTQVINSLKQPG